jgi:adenylate cyclase
MLRKSILRRKVKTVILFSLIGAVVGTSMGYVNFLIVGAQPATTIGWGITSGFMIGAIIGWLESFVFFGRMRRAPVMALLVLRGTVYTLTFAFWLTLANAARVAEAQGIPFWDAGRFYLLDEGIFLRDFAVTMVAAIGCVSILQALQLQRGRDVFNFILGKYHRPQEVDLSFLFVDLTSSTSIAERLGHLRYSAFLQDFFFDVNMAALATGGEIYQYVGDEVIVIWPRKGGADCLPGVDCLFGILDEIEGNRARYLEEYDVVPTLRAGLHGGKTVVTWVGETKKEIVYHGDVLNTAARIQTHAKQGPHPMLISGPVLQTLDLPDRYTAHAVGEVKLRGKETALPLFGLERVGDS